MTIRELAEPRRRVGTVGERLLEVEGLETSFRTPDGVVRAVTGVDFHVDRGEILGLVGESGCGKSVTSLSIMRLIAPPGRITAGSVRFDGRDLLRVSDREIRKLRGNRIEHDLPAADEQPEPGLQRRRAARRGAASCIAT